MALSFPAKFIHWGFDSHSMCGPKVERVCVNLYCLALGIASDLERTKRESPGSEVAASQRSALQQITHLLGNAPAAVYSRHAVRISAVSRHYFVPVLLGVLVHTLAAFSGIDTAGKNLLHPCFVPRLLVCHWYNHATVSSAF